MLLMSDREFLKEKIYYIVENGEILLSSQRYDELLEIIIDILKVLEKQKNISLYRYFDLFKDVLTILRVKDVDVTDLLITSLDILSAYEGQIDEMEFENIEIDTFVLQSAKHAIFIKKEQYESLSVLNLYQKDRLLYFLKHDDLNLKIFTELKNSGKIDIVIAPLNEKIIQKIRRKTDKPIAVISDKKVCIKEIEKYDNIYFISDKLDDDDFYEELLQILNTYHCKYIKNISDEFEIKPLSDTIVKLRDLGENASLREISAIISKDIALSTKIVSYVNRPFFGVTKEINAVNQAITFLGKEKTLAYVFGQGVRDCLGVDLSFYKINEDQFCKINYLRSQLATHWYKNVNFSEFIIVSSAAMLGAIGKIYLNKALKEIDSINQEKFDTYLQFDRLFAEKEALGVSSEEISAMLLNKWGFSNELVNSIYYASDIESSPMEYKHLAIANYVIFNTFDLNEEIDMKIVKNLADFLNEMNFDSSLYLKAIEKIKDN